jgi:hypothetical protein
MRSCIKILVCVWLAFSLLPGCTEDITSEIKSQMDAASKKLIVDGEVTTDTTRFRISLKRAADYFSNTPLEAVSNAQVYIKDESNSYSLNEDTEAPGNYYSQPNVYGLSGHTYTLHITNVDIDDDGVMETYTATSELKAAIPVDSVRIAAVKRMRRTTYNVMVFYTDPAQTRDYYMFRVRRNNILLSDTITKCSFTSDQYFNGTRINNINVYALRPYRQSEDVAIGDKITLETCIITKDYYEFMQSLKLEVRGSNPFGGQPANVSTNIYPKEKASGFFTAYPVSRVSTTVKDTIR